MGRRYWGRKVTADESCKLTMPCLRKRGLLSGLVTGEMSWTNSRTGQTTTAISLTVDTTTNDPFARLSYTVTGSKGQTDYDYKVPLETTPCHFGGIRYWFGCPNCGRRIAVLYLTPGGVNFKCRHCHNLSYYSRNDGLMARFGEVGREIDALRNEIKRWTWDGRPTRKVRRLQALERKIGMLSEPIMEG